MPDWTYDVAQALSDYMDHLGPLQIAAVLLLMPIVSVALVAVHELGHAVAVVVLGHRLHGVRVGNQEPVVIVRSRAFVLQLGPVNEGGGYGGYVHFDAAGAGPWHVIVIALAGPLAELLAGAASGWAFVAVAHRQLLLMAALVAIVESVRNLQVRSDGLRTDGSMIRDAWRARRQPADPNAATSVAPPGR